MLNYYDRQGRLITTVVKPAPIDVTIWRQQAIIQWTNMPAALTELFGSALHRVPAELTDYTDARITIQKSIIAGAAGAVIAGQYSTDQVTWAYLDGAAGPSLPVDLAAGVTKSGWVSLAAAAKADVWLRLVGTGGDGAIDPFFNGFGLQFR